MIDNVHATGAILTNSITGLPGFEVEDGTLSNIRIASEEAGKLDWVTREVPEQAKSYPEARMFGRLPAYGFYCRHVKGLRLRSVDLSATADEARPAIVCDDVQSLDVSGFRAAAVTSGQPVIRLKNTRSALLTGCTAPAGTKTFLEVAGERSTEVSLAASQMSGAGKGVEFVSGERSNPA
jgi:hypothetical protein